MKSPNDLLLEAIRSRAEKRTQFNYGILTADRYVKTFQDRLGTRSCYKHMCQTKGGRWSSFDDVLKRASETLTYANTGMVLEEKSPKLPDGVVLPKNTLIVFRHILTTNTKDRDGDILRTDGAEIDPKMLLLFQHVHTLPIGKMLAVADHTKQSLSLYSCIIDMNELCHDSAVMVDNDMGRFSHGFAAKVFDEAKAGANAPGGYDVKKYEILEESLVSVPANPDAETEDVILSLVEGGKMTSDLMKDCAASIREHKPLQVPVSLDLKLTLNGQEVSHENQSRNEKGRADGTGTSKEAGSFPDKGQGKEKQGTEDNEMKSSFTTSFVRPTYSGDLAGSWEWIEASLRMTVRKFMEEKGVVLEEYDWATVIGTFSDYVIIGVEKAKAHTAQFDYYKVKWSVDNGVVSFDGDLEEVHLQTTTEIVEKMKKLVLARNKAQALMDDEDSGGTEGTPSTSENEDDDEENKMVCPDCEYVGPGKEGKCPECGAKLLPKKSFVLEKLGRVLSKANESKLKEAVDDLAEAVKTDGISRGCRALIKQAKSNVSDVVSSLGSVDDSVAKSVTGVTVKDAIALIISEGTSEDVDKLLLFREASVQMERDEKLVNELQAIT